LRGLEIGDDAVLQWPAHINALRRLAQHVLSLSAGSKDLFQASGAIAHGKNGRLIENNAPVFQIEKCICSSEVNADVFRRRAEY